MQYQSMSKPSKLLALAVSIADWQNFCIFAALEIIELKLADPSFQPKIRETTSNLDLI